MTANDSTPDGGKNLTESTDTEPTRSDVVAATIDDLQAVDSLADTPFSKLFHEARTSTPDRIGTNGYSGVTLQVRVRDGTFETHDTPVKTRQGEHLRGTNAWDGMVSLPVKSFMETRTARQEIVRQLKELQRNMAAKEERERRLQNR